jgi:threonine dehydrogenase-like Zn-dependent dehydrogenase
VVVAGASSGFVQGDKVFAVHPHQDLFNIQAGGRLVTKIPDGVDLLRAQFAAMFGVALQVLLQRPVRPGEVVAVSGLGLVGIFVAFLARLSAGRLIVIDPLPLRRKKAAWIGADAVVAPEDAAEAIRKHSSARGTDLFIETSGAAAALQSAIVNTAILGTVAVAAWYGTRPVTLSLSPEFHLRSLKIISIQVHNLDEDDRWPPLRKFLTCLEYLGRIDVEQLVSHRFAFDHALEAYRLLDERQAETLAVLLEHSNNRPAARINR